MPIEHKAHGPSSRLRAHLNWLLDEALKQTFPANDPVAIDIDRESHDREARVFDFRALRSLASGRWARGLHRNTNAYRAAIEFVLTAGAVKQTNCCASATFKPAFPAVQTMKHPSEKSDEAGLAGLVERVTYHNVENGFCVLRAKARGHRDVVTVVGHAAAIAAGEWITASGEWVNDRTHGQQFKARFLRTSPPTSADGIEKYLSSGMIRGIGPAYAKKLLRAFGEKVFDIIEATPDRLREVDGIGPGNQPAASPLPGLSKRPAGNHGVSAQSRRRYGAGSSHLQDLWPGLHPGHDREPVSLGARHPRHRLQNGRCHRHGAAPSMRFVAVKSERQQAAGLVFRTRDLLVRQRTQLINAIRGHLTEYGWIAPKGPSHVAMLADLLEEEEMASSLPEAARAMFRLMLDLLAGLNGKIADLDKEIARRAREDEVSRRLMTVPGIARSLPPQSPLWHRRPRPLPRAA